MLRLCLGVLALGLAACSSTNSHPPLKTTANVDPNRYAGVWYEQFRLPTPFQDDKGTATASYTLLPSGSIRVVNTETLPSGKKNTATGTATAVRGSGNARLRVKFQGLAALVPVPEEGNYWIIRLAPDYSAALVGTPDRRFLWLLTREQKASRATLETYAREARAQGFNLSTLIVRPDNASARPVMTGLPQ